MRVVAGPSRLTRAAARVLPALLAVAACSPGASSSPSSAQASTPFPSRNSSASVEQTTESEALPNPEAAEPGASRGVVGFGVEPRWLVAGCEHGCGETIALGVEQAHGVL